MPLPKEHRYTSEDYWNLPKEQRSELIDGQLYDMAPPSFQHQNLSSLLHIAIGSYIQANHGTCKVLAAPFAVNLDAQDHNWVEPDLSVICNREKLTERGCLGAPDLIIEIVSPSSRKMDYRTKHNLYANAGVREYWIVDPEKEKTVLYRFEEDEAPVIYPFDQTIGSGIFRDLDIRISDLLEG